MNILELCEGINLQPEMKKQVAAFADGFDFDMVDKQLKAFRIYEKMDDARIELQNILGDDENHIKILACMLQASANVYDIYRAKGINDKIYFDTMKCYTRFIDETYKRTGRFDFDRFWWTVRQAGCNLFRIGELEYEMAQLDDQMVIELHIPSDADFSPSAVDESLEIAQAFFAKYYPELSDCEYHCHSWLLDRQLKGMLKENSNILSFQNRFEMFDDGEIDMEFIEWLFGTQTTDYTALPENTSLQRNMKKHIMSGGVIRNSYGKLRK